MLARTGTYSVARVAEQVLHQPAAHARAAAVHALKGALAGEVQRRLCGAVLPWRPVHSLQVPASVQRQAQRLRTGPRERRPRTRHTPAACLHLPRVHGGEQPYVTRQQRVQPVQLRLQLRWRVLLRLEGGGVATQ